MKKMNMLYRDPKEGQSDAPTVPAEAPETTEIAEVVEGSEEEAAEGDE